MTNPYAATEGVNKALTKILEDASALSNLSEVLPPASVGESLLDLHNRLLTVRSRQQSVSEVLTNLLKTQAGVRKLVLECKSILDSAEANAVGTTKPAFVEDFSSAKERNAKLMAKTLEERMSLRSAEKLQIDTDAALAYVQQVYRDLGNQAQDVQTRIRILGMEGTWS